MKLEILAVIPARGGSKSILRKNLKLLNGKPLIYYQMQNALKSTFVTDVVLTSEDEEILSYASRFPVNLRRRPLELAEDHVTLDPVIHDATEFMENKLVKKYDVIVTLQPTSPLLSFRTLDNSIETFLNEQIDTMQPVIDATHLYWKEEGDKVVPDYEKRLNRQWLPTRYKETGAFLITKRKYVKKDTRFGENIRVFILNESEGIDIDSPLDWMIAESLMKQLKIAFVVNGNKNIGMGHVYRDISIANMLIGHGITFVTYASDEGAVELIKSSGHQIVKITEKSLLKTITEIKPSIVINDILDTSKDYILRLKKEGFFVVNFEDLGDGTEEAHLVFNALYEKTDSIPNQRFGYKYECLNEKFLLHPPITFKKCVETLLLTFGGVDQNNLTYRILELVPELLRRVPLKNIISVVGLGYSQIGNLRELIQGLGDFPIELYQNIDSMPRLMSRVDVAVTSNGRTVYELAAMGVPTLSIAQNDRETLHSFARYHKGVRYLGMAHALDQSKILDEIVEVSTNNTLRRSMYQAQIKEGEEIRKGNSKVINEMFLEYWRQRDERDKDW